MNSKLTFSLLHLTIPAVVGLWLAIALQLPLKEWFFPTQPYTNVKILTQEVVNNTFHVKATFFKNECKFQFMKFYGQQIGEEDVWEALPYFDRDVPEGDRVQGWHTMDIDVPLINKYSTIELRTRHECMSIEGDKTIIETVDKIFYSFDIIKLQETRV